MNILFTIVLLLQGSPDEAMEKLREALSEKNVKAIQELAPDPNDLAGLTPELMNRYIADLNRDTRGNLNKVLEAVPTLGTIADPISNIEMEFVLPRKDGAVHTEVQFEKVQGEWKIDELEFDWMDYKVGATDPIAKESPGEVVKAIHSAAVKEDYENILSRLAPQLRMTVNSAAIRGMIMREERRLKGKWLESIAKFPQVRESKGSLSKISMELELQVNEEQVTLSAMMIKNKGKWVLAEIETTLESDGEEEEPNHEEDPR